MTILLPKLEVHDKISAEKYNSHLRLREKSLVELLIPIEGEIVSVKGSRAELEKEDSLPNISPLSISDGFDLKEYYLYQRDVHLTHSSNNSTKTNNITIPKLEIEISTQHPT